MQFTLIKFTFKRELRLWLRQANLFTNKRSSLYVYNQHNYVVIAISLTQPLIATNQVKIINSNQLTLEECSILKWGKSEITQDLNFVHFETQSILQNNGRVLRVNGQTITRSFTYLADIFAILNYTADSFSDGGKFNQIDKACQRIQEHLHLGASIIDLGVESTNPQSHPLTSEEELAKFKLILPLILELKKHYPFKLSIDTYHEKTAYWLLEQEIDILNDVSGNLPLNIVAKFTSSSRQYVAMHSLTVPASTSIKLNLAINPVKQIQAWITAKLTNMLEFGINLSQVIFDPGLGFGNNAAQAWYILTNLSQFNLLPGEILIGHSRKSFLSHITNINHSLRDLESGMIAAYLMDQVDYFRLHDLKALNRLYPIIHQLKTSQRQCVKI